MIFEIMKVSFMVIGCLEIKLSEFYLEENLRDNHKYIITQHTKISPQSNFCLASHHEIVGCPHGFHPDCTTTTDYSI